MPLLAFLAALLMALPQSALAARSDWADAGEARLRLLLVPAADGKLMGGVEIQLEPGWYTYWRVPGSSGIPPDLDFSASTNVGSVEVHYPVPERFDDGTGISLIYRDHVVFPLTVVPDDPELPVTLRLEALYGICEVVCIPTRAEAEVTLAPDAPDDPLARVTIEVFQRALPGPAEPGRLAIDAVRLGEEGLDIVVRAPEAGPVDLFVEGPEDWYLGQPQLVDREDRIVRFRLPLAGKPKGASPVGQTLRFVAVAGSRAIEEEVVLGH